MSTWTLVPAAVPNVTTGFLNESFLSENTGFLGDIVETDGWTKVPKESADD